MKPLREITEPDPRCRVFTVHDQGALRPLTLADHHAMVADIVLPAGVPADVQTLFERARAALLYGWFAYELTPLAEHQACAALECALRQRFLAGGGALPRPSGLLACGGCSAQRWSAAGFLRAPSTPWPRFSPSSGTRWLTATPISARRDGRQRPCICARR